MLFLNQVCGGKVLAGVSVLPFTLIYLSKINIHFYCNYSLVPFTAIKMVLVLFWNFQNSRISWQTPATTRSCCLPGRAGTMHRACRSGNTTPVSSSSATLPPKEMVRKATLVAPSSSSKKSTSLYYVLCYITCRGPVCTLARAIKIYSH